LALTRAQCAPGSLHDQIVKQWGNTRSYVIRDGHLFLALKADGGIYEFELRRPASDGPVCIVAVLPRDVERDVAILSQTLLHRVVGYRHVPVVGFYTYAISGHTSGPQFPGDGFGARS
jgi:hypothetical protein